MRLSPGTLIMTSFEVEVNDKQFSKTKVSCVEFPEYICKDENFEEKMKIDSVKHFTALNVIIFVEFERSKF